MDFRAILLLCALLPALTVAGPAITTFNADDPADLNSVYSDGDTVTLVFDAETNQPTLATKSNMDSALSFSESLGQDYYGIWFSSTVFVVYISNTTNNGNPTIGTTTVSCIQGGVFSITSAQGNAPCTSTSPVLTGDWGQPCGACSTGAYRTVSGAPCQSCPEGFACPDPCSVPEMCPSGTYAQAGAVACTNCTTGTYQPSAGQNSCIDCPAGYECVDQTAEPVACGLGNYSAVGSGVCEPCPAGVACSNADTQVGCAVGTYAPQGSTSCQNCPEGHYCPSANSDPIPCPAGTWSNGGQVQTCSTCTSGTYSNTTGATSCAYSACGYETRTSNDIPMACNPGYYAAEGDGTCTACEAGTYATFSGSCSCTECRAGYKCPSTSAVEVQCPQGFYSEARATKCTKCPSGTQSNDARTGCTTCRAGQTCVDPEVDPVTCSEGYYSLNGTSTDCTVCPAGSYCPTNDELPIACPDGTYSLQGQTSCTTCPAGFTCSSDTTPTQCGEGEYSPAGSTICLVCPPGYQCSSLAESPTECSSGTYAPKGSSVCTDCPPCSACPSPDVNPVSCGDGYYAVGNATACQVCPVGFSCPSCGSEPVQCQSGEYSREGVTGCITCPGGYDCSTTDGLPTACADGTYSMEGEALCSECPAGYYCETPESGPTAQCADGTYSPAGSSVCISCPSGYACPTKDGLNITACPTGYIATGAATVCTPCPAGFECPSPDGVDRRACTEGYYSLGGSDGCQSCPAGYACTTNSITACEPGTYSSGGQRECTKCPAGYACPYTDKPILLPCTVGQYANEAQEACSDCPAGFACQTVTGNNIEPCAAGYYSEAGSSVCLACPAGRLCANSTAVGDQCAPGYYSLAGAYECLPCPAGHFCPDPAARPETCPAGSYSRGTTDACSPCDAGYICGPGEISPTPSYDRCPPGSYCPAGSASPTNCPAGYYGNSTGATSFDGTCLVCPAGYYCPQGSVDPMDHLLCPAGYYCPAGTGSGTSFACPAGYYNDITGANALADCKLCPAGRYCQAGTSVPQLCNSGYYCPPGTVSSWQYPCPAGTYTGNVRGLDDMTKCRTCPPGAYCVSGSVNPVMCNPGSFSAGTAAVSSASCIDCPAGMACPKMGLSFTNITCEYGHYCPAGTVNPNDNKCPAGTYTNMRDISRAQDCTTCPERFSCIAGTGGQNNPPQLCSTGHYCPLGTEYANQYPCPAGFYTPETNLMAASECTSCPEGSYCVGGQASISGPCQAGYYCPLESSTATAYPCPAGTYSSRTDLSRADQCTDCTAGHYCPAASTAPTMCPGGSYTDLTNSETAGPGTFPQCIICPAGYYCPEPVVTGNVAPTECGLGYHSAAGALNCTICPAGHFCDSTTTTTTEMNSKLCRAGTYCPEGHTKDSELVNEACPVGHYCPEATTAPIGCPAGTYQPFTGRGAASDCMTCPAGHYCTAASSAIAGECSPGYYCPAGSSSATHAPCPAGTYRALAKAEHDQMCAVCPTGEYCAEASVASVTCPQGYYCPAGCPTPTPCPPGSYGNTTGLIQADWCTPCPGGQYCEGHGLTSPRGECDPGHYCVEGSYTSAPVGHAAGDVCPKGYYCPMGSAAPRACPAGTFLNSTGAQAESECTVCVGGSYCSGTANAEPSGLCSAGFYCPERSTMSTEVPSPIGHYSLAGQSLPTQCPAGTYQPQVAQSVCLPCLKGFYCPSMMTTDPTDCTVGHYCPESSVNPTACPAGTFQPDLNRNNATACLSCTPGKYCLDVGGSAVTGDCSAGYYCADGADTPTPSSLPMGDVCPVGHYCPAGTAVPQACPVSTYSPSTGNTDVSQCLACSSGSYCATTGLSAPTGSCSPGYYCVSGSSSSTPGVDTPGSYGPCAAGYMCDGGATPTICPAGTYSSAMSSSCTTCPAGYYCPAGTTDTTWVLCPMGSYCPEGSGSATGCPAGSYGNSTGFVSSAYCTPCPAGEYCSASGLTAPNGQCSAGFVCAQGATDNTGVPCPAGSYCPAGSGSATPCPVGSVGTVEGLTSVSDCTGCVAGKYCPEVGNAQPAGDCAAGYWCQSGASSPTPSSGTTYGPCPAGSYCPAGSGEPTACPAGTYNGLERQEVCQPCPAGYYCAAGSTDYSSNICPMGYYCPNGTATATENPCPAGTWNDQQMSQSLANCQACPPTYYCGNTAMTQGNLTQCSAGYYCSSGASTGTPTDGTTGNICPSGSYCPAGSSEPISCPAGEYCASTGLSSSTGTCSAGYFCTSGAVSATPSSETCSSSNLLASTCMSLSLDGSDDQVTAPSFALSSSGDVSIDVWIYPKSVATSFGTIFEAGDGTDNTATTGVLLHFEGTTGQLAFRVGTTVIIASSALSNDQWYHIGATRSSSTGMGYLYVDGASVASGTMDAAPTAAQSSILVGSSAISGRSRFTGYVDELRVWSRSYTTTQLASLAHVDPVSDATGLEAHYKFNDNDNGLSAADSSTNARSATVVGGAVFLSTCGTTVCNKCMANGACPAGYYCPAGTSSPVACPIGTYSSQLGLSAQSECTTCTEGYYCKDAGLDQPSGTCAEGYYCAAGSTTATPSSGVCPVGYYCPSGSSTQIKCSSGTYQDQTGQSTCKSCPVGYYCDSSVDPSTPQACPAGNYCPAGTTFATQYPCPAGTFLATTMATSLDQCQNCTAGMYCSSTGLTATTGTCDAGYFCSGGASSATPGSTLTAGSCTINDANCKCPAGYYCPAGSTQPTPCAAGTYSASEGATVASACSTVPPGKFSNGVGASSSSGSSDCAAGYVCVGGSSTDTPTNCAQSSAGSCTDGGYLCDAGYYCPAGATTPLLCPAGTYNANSGAGSCTSCPAGYVCSTEGLTDYTAEVCPQGYYCEAGTSVATNTPCPAGTYGAATKLTALGQCSSCPAGQYCGTSALSAPTGDCAAGTVCDGGADRATYTTTVGVNGPCPAGHYCFAGTSTTSSPTQCPTGTYRADTGGASVSDCIACPGGKYCDSMGLTAATGDCSAGHMCPNGTTSATQHPCPVGYYQPSTGQTDCLACPAGQYQSSTGQTACLTCAAGTHAETSGMSSCVTCPLYKYCPAGSSSGVFCGDGTYNNATTGLYDQSQCEACPAGVYCTNGQITGDCYAGYTCYTCNVKPNPDVYSYTNPNGTETAPSYCNATCTTSECNNNPRYGEPCPQNHYCVSGSTLPTLCPDGKYRICGNGQCSCLGGTQETDCQDCQAGQLCASGQDPVDCPVGYYCSSGQAAVACPAGTYQPNTKMTVASDCLTCPAGWWCAGEATGALDNPCPVGHWCPAGVGLNVSGVVAVPEPIACDAGYYLSSSGGSVAANCTQCPSGKFCASGSVTPQACPAGYYCEAGVSDAAICLGGTYCPENSTFPATCEPGYYCPQGVAMQIPCASGTYCPSPVNYTWIFTAGDSYYSCDNATSACAAQCQNSTLVSQLECTTIDIGTTTLVENWSNTNGYCRYTNDPYRVLVRGSTSPSYCPAGTITDTTATQSSTVDSCTHCAEGTYSNAERTACETCSAGYICTGWKDSSGNYVADSAGMFRGATTATPTLVDGDGDSDGDVDGGFQCPQGSYCLAGAVAPILCPAGTYNDVKGATDESACKACPENTYGNLVGQTACYPCGSSSTSASGSTTCTCTGADRSFLPTTGECLCNRGFEFINSEFVKDEGDSTFDCTSITYPRCGANEDLDSTGTCVSTTDPTVCDAWCDNGGTFDASLRLCICNGEAGADAVCDTSCRQAQTQLVLKTTAQNKGVFYDAKLTGTQCSDVNTESVSGLVSNPNCNFAAAESNGDRICGIVHLVRVVEDNFYYVYNASDAYVLAIAGMSCPTTDGGAYVTTQVVKNPVTCVEYGESMLFDVRPAEGSTGFGFAPVYSKDDFYISTDSFDYGGFRNLETRVATDDTTVSYLHTFTTPGIFVFTHPNNANKKLMIKVQQQGESCQTGGTFEVNTDTTNTGGVSPVTQSTTTDAATSPSAMVMSTTRQTTRVDRLRTMATTPFASTGSGGASGLSVSSTTLSLFGVSTSGEVSLSPDWLLIGSLLGAVIVLTGCCIGSIQFLKNKEWSKFRRDKPKYMRLGQQHELSEFGTNKNLPQRRLKVNKLEDGEGGAGAEVAISVGVARPPPTGMEDKFWETERMIDMDGFNVKTFYDKLTDQTNLLASQLAVSQDDAKAFFDRVSNQTDQLKDLLAAKLDNFGKAKDTSATAEKCRINNEDEIRRRKSLARSVGGLVSRQKQLNSDDEVRRADYAQQQQELHDSLQGIKAQLTATIGKGLEHPRLASVPAMNQLFKQMDDKTEKLFSLLNKEAERRGLYLDNDNGAGLLNPVTNAVMTRQELTNEDGELREIPGVVRRDARTGLFMPAPGSTIRLGNGTDAIVPNDVCLHPASGRVVPMAGHVVADLTHKKLVFATGPSVDLAVDSCYPYIPVPASTNCALLSKLRPVDGGKVFDPITGLNLPILGVVSDMGGRLLPVAGVYVDPITTLQAPIAYGSFMLDASTGGLVPIMGVTVDPESGKARPLGIMESIMGASTHDDYSNKKVKVGGCGLDSDRGIPMAIGGGGATLFDTQELEAEKDMVMAMKDTVRQLEKYKGMIEGGVMGGEELSSNLQKDIRTTDSTTRTMSKFWAAARARNQMHRLRNKHTCAAMEKLVEQTAQTGGMLGYHECRGSGIKIPILIGGKMVDHETGFIVPILHSEVDATSDEVVPVGGSMKDASTGRVVPIELGSRMLDRESGRNVPVTGAIRDGSSGRAVPINSPFGNSSLQGSSPQDLALVEGEMHARDSFERRVRALFDELQLLEAQLVSSMAELVDDASVPNIVAAKDLIEVMMGKTEALQSIYDREQDRRKAVVAADTKGLLHHLKKNAAVVLEKERELLNKLENYRGFLQRYHRRVMDLLKKAEDADRVAQTGAMGGAAQQAEVRQEARSLAKDFENEGDTIGDLLAAAGAAETAREDDNIQMKLLRDQLAEVLNASAAQDDALAAGDRSASSTNPQAISPELLKVLAGLLGLPGGKVIDPNTGLLHPQESTQGAAVSANNTAGSNQRAGVSAPVAGSAGRQWPALKMDEYDPTDAMRRAIEQGKADASRLEDHLMSDAERQKLLLKDRLANRRRNRVSPDGSNIHEFTEDSLALQHAQEREDLDAFCTTQQESAERELAASLDREKEKLVQEQRNKIKMIELSDMDDDEKARLIAQSQRDLERLEGILDGEKQRQMDELRKKLAAQRRARREAQANRHNAEQEALSVEQKHEVEREALNARQAEEAKKLADQLNAEAKAEERNLQAETDERAKERTAMLRRHKQELAKPMSDEDRARLIAKHKAELASLDEHMVNERDRQRFALADRLAARRKKKEDELKARHSSEAAQLLEAHEDEVKATLAALSSEEEGLDMDLTSDIIQASQALRSQEQEQRQALDTLQRDHQAEEHSLKDALDKDDASKLAQAEAELEAQKKNYLAEKQAQFERSLRSRTDLSDAERERLMREHMAELTRLEEQMEGDKQRQKDNLKARLAKRRNKKLTELAEKQNAELSNERKQQERERSDLASQVQKEAEQVVIEALSGEVPADQANGVVASVLENRHQKEMADLLAKQMGERARALNSAMAKTDADYKTRLYELKRRHEEEAAEMEASRNTMPEDQYNAERVDMLNRQNAEKQQLEKQHAAAEMQVAKDALEDLDKRHKTERDQLRDKQMGEIAATCHEIAAKDVLDAHKKANAIQAQEELTEFRSRGERERAEELARVKEERAKFEEEQKLKMEEELRKLDAELERERLREQGRAEKVMEDLQARKERLLMEKKRAQEEELYSASSQDERDALVRKHQAELRSLEGAMDQEQSQQRAKLQDKLRKRREQRRTEGIAKIKADYEQALQDHDSKGPARGDIGAGVMEVDTAVRPEESVRQVTAVKVQKTAADAARAGLDASIVGNKFADRRSEDEWFQLLMTSPLFEKLKIIEEMLRTGIKPGGVTQPQYEEQNGKPKSSSDPRYSYLDAKDATWTCQGPLEPMDVNELSSMNFVVYKFGLYIMDQLSVFNGLEPVTLLIAKNLPPNENNHNAFRNSFHYDVQNRTLFMRRERLDNVGEYVLVLVHCLAHIRVKDMADDTNPLFLQNFYRSLKVVCEELFFSRAKRTSALPDATSGTALEQIFRRLPNAGEKQDVVEELIDCKVKAVDDTAYFSKDKMAERLDMYSQFSLSTQLVDYLYGVEEKLHKTEAQSMEDSMASLRMGGDKPGDAYESFLRAQLGELQNRLDEANNDYLDILKEYTTTKANVKGVEDEVEVANMKASLVEEGSEAYEESMASKKDLSTRLRKGRDALGRVSARKDHAAKELIELKDDYAHKTTLLREHLDRTGAEKEAVSEDLLADVKSKLSSR